MKLVLWGWQNYGKALDIPETIVQGIKIWSHRIGLESQVSHITDFVALDSLPFFFFLN